MSLHNTPCNFSPVMVIGCTLNKTLLKRLLGFRLTPSGTYDPSYKMLGKKYSISFIALVYSTNLSELKSICAELWVMKITTQLIISHRQTSIASGYSDTIFSVDNRPKYKPVQTITARIHQVTYTKVNHPYFLHSSLMRRRFYTEMFLHLCYIMKEISERIFPRSLQSRPPQVYGKTNFYSIYPHTPFDHLTVFRYNDLIMLLLWVAHLVDSRIKLSDMFVCLHEMNWWIPIFI